MNQQQRLHRERKPSLTNFFEMTQHSAKKQNNYLLALFVMYEEKDVPFSLSHIAKNG